MQTSLHSCGSQLGPCACGCRQFAFHDDRLMQKGLHGLLVRLTGTARCGTNTYPCFRHVHPAELALLNGMNPNMPWGEDMKMALCALGQLASPIQATWVGSLLMKHLQTLEGSPKIVDPHQNLLSWITVVLQGRDEVFGTQTNPNAKHFQQLVSTGIYATKPKSQEAVGHAIDPNHAMLNPTMNMTMPSTEESPEISVQTAETHVESWTSGHAVDTISPGVKRSHESIHTSSSNFHEANMNGGVLGFENHAVKRSRTHDMNANATQPAPLSGMPTKEIAALHPATKDLADRVSDASEPNPLPHAMPLPRPGCGGPTHPIPSKTEHPKVTVPLSIFEGLDVSHHDKPDSPVPVLQPLCPIAEACHTGSASATSPTCANVKHIHASCQHASNSSFPSENRPPSFRPCLFHV